MTSGTNYAEAGEILEDSVIELYKATAAITKGAICQVTPLEAGSTVAPTAAADAATVGPYAVAIEAAASGEIVRCVVGGRVSVVTSVAVGQGAIVASLNGKATAFVNGTTAAMPLGRISVGAPANGIATLIFGGS